MSREYLKRTQGDYGDTLTFNLEESNGDPSDLSGNISIRLQARLEGDVPGVDTLRLDEVMTVVTPPGTDGQVSYIVQTGTPVDFAIAGKYYVQIEAIFPTREITWDIAIITVEEQHG